MKDLDENKDFLNKIKDLPKFDTGDDFLEKLHLKIAEIDAEENKTSKKKNSDKEKSFIDSIVEKIKSLTLFPVLAVVAVILIVSYFIFKPHEPSIDKEISKKIEELNKNKSDSAKIKIENKTENNTETKTNNTEEKIKESVKNNNFKDTAKINIKTDIKTEKNFTNSKKKKSIFIPEKNNLKENFSPKEKSSEDLPPVTNTKTNVKPFEQNKDMHIENKLSESENNPAKIEEKLGSVNKKSLESLNIKVNGLVYSVKPK